jgi:small subunit ribosomal protein S2
MRDTGALAQRPKKEQLKLNEEMAKLNRLLGGIRGMRRLPDALFIIDTRKEHIAIHEAQRLDIPVVALVDTNADPDEATYPIPANDDAIRAVRLLSARMADAALEGAQEYASTRAKEEAEEGFEPSAYEGYTFEPEGYEAAIEPEDDEREEELRPAYAGLEEEIPEAVQPDEAVEVPALERGIPSVPVAPPVAEAATVQAAEPAAARAPEPVEAAAEEGEPSTHIVSGTVPGERGVVSGSAADSEDAGLPKGLVETGEQAFAGEVPPEAAESAPGPVPETNPA